MNVDVTPNWINSYLKVLTVSILVFTAPKLFIEYFAISDINFAINKSTSAQFASRWMHFVTMFTLFEIIGVYIIISGWNIRRRFLVKSQLIFIYISELLVVSIASALLVFDILSGKSMAGSNMIGAGNMERALAGYTVFLTQNNVFSVLEIMHVIFTTGSVIYAVTIISNFAVCSVFWENGQVALDDIEDRRDEYYRNLYGSTALLTIGVLQLAAWLGLPTDNIVEKVQFTNLVTSITIYLSMLFTLIAVVSAGMAAFMFNANVKLAISDPVVRERLKITMFDRTMLISVFLPAIAGYLIKAVPLLFA